MKNKKSLAILGLFVITSVFIACSFLLALKGKRLFANNPTYTIMVDRSVKGLGVGASVTFRGVKIGQVTRIVLMPVSTIMAHDASNRWPLEITVEIDPDTIDFDRDTLREMRELENGSEKRKFLKFLSTGKELVDQWLEYMVTEHSLTAKLKMSSLLTGMLYIELDFSKDYAPSPEEIAMLHKGYIPLQATSTEKLREVFSSKRLIDSVNGAIALFEDTVASGKAAQMIANIHAFTTDAASMTKNMDKLVAETREELPRLTRRADGTLADIDTSVQELTARLKETLTLLQEQTRDVRAVVAKLDKDVDLTNGPLAEIVSNMDSASRRLNTLLASCQELADAIREPEKASSLDRNAITALLQELEETARSIRVLANMVRDNPEVLLRGK